MSRIYKRVWYGIFTSHDLMNKPLDTVKYGNHNWVSKHPTLKRTSFNSDNGMIRYKEIKPSQVARELLR